MRFFLAACIMCSTVLLCGCAYKGGSGSVNPSVRDYNSLTIAAQEKNIVYNCDFDRIARQDFVKHGDYCGKAENEDYVSRVVSYDIQQTHEIKLYLSQISGSFKKNDNSFIKYYSIYAASSSDFDDKNFSSVPPTSFAVDAGDAGYAVGITKKDLLFRAFIKPVLSIKAVNPLYSSSGDVEDFVMDYSISVYNFDVKYDSDSEGILFGLPSYRLFSARDKAAEDLALGYSGMLGEFWKAPWNYKSRRNGIRVIDYALPQLGAVKFKSGLKGKYEISSSEKGLITDYLPGYELESVSLVSVHGELVSYGAGEIYKFLISADVNDALVHVYNESAPVSVVYRYKAVKPEHMIIDNYTAEKTGLGYIYSDIASDIVVELKIDEYFNLSTLPYNCIGQDEEKRISKEGSKGLHNFVSNLPVYDTVECSGNQKGLVNNMNKIFK